MPCQARRSRLESRKLLRCGERHQNSEESVNKSVLIGLMENTAKALVMTVGSIVSMVMLSVVVTIPAWAQEGERQIDSAHSTASLNLLSSGSGTAWNVGIAKVSGTVKCGDHPGNDKLGEDILDLKLNIYPAREGSQLLDGNGNFRGNSSANLSRYTLMSFHSSRVSRNGNGKVSVTGELSVTYVHREANINWNNAYSGADYGEPVARSTSGTITFVIESDLIESDQIKTNQGSQISGLTTIPLRDFPTLRASWLDSVWPLVVEDEHCEIPDVRGSTRDYQGAVCTGTPIEFTPLPQSSQVRIGADYPGPDEVTAPASDAATIMIHLWLEGGT